jgi:hypothetical protein
MSQMKIHLSKRTLPVGVGLIALLISITISNAFAAPAAPAAKEDFVLTQKSTRMGDCYIYISPQGFQMVNPRSGSTVSSRYPDWKVFMYNTRSHLYYESTMDSWCRDMLIDAGYDEWGPGSKWVKKGIVKVCGYKGTVYQIDGEIRTHGANGQVSVIKDTVSAQYVLAEGYKVNPVLAKMMNAVFNLPLRPGVPLRFTYLERDGSERPVLQTYRIDRCNLTLENFNLPVGYTLAHSRAEVVADPAQLQMLQKMAGGANLNDPKVMQAMSAALNKNAYGRKIEGQQGATPRLSPQMLEKLMEMYKKNQPGK